MSKLNDNPELLEEIIKQTTDISNINDYLSKDTFSKLFPNKHIYHIYSKQLICACIEYRKEIDKQFLYDILIERLPKDIVNIIIEYSSKPLYLYVSYDGNSIYYLYKLYFDFKYCHSIKDLLMKYNFQITNDIKQLPQDVFNKND